MQTKKTSVGNSTKSNKSNKTNTAYKAVEQDLQSMSLSQLWSQTDADWADSERESKLENAKFDMQGGLIDMERQISEARRAVNEATKEQIQQERNLISSRKSGFSVQTEIDYFRYKKVISNKVAAAQDVVTQLEAVRAHLESISSQLFA